MSELTDLAGELETMRSEIAELDVLEEPTEEQSTRMAELLDEWNPKKERHDELEAKAARLDAIRSASLNPNNREAAFSAPNVIIKKDPFEGLDENSMRGGRLDESDLRSRALEAFGDDVKIRGISDREHEALVSKIEDESSYNRGLAAHVLVHGSPAYRSAFGSWFQAQKANHAPVLTEAQGDAFRASMALGSTTGGAVLPTLLDPTLIRTGTAAKDPLRSVARVISGTQNVWHGASVGNVTANWTAEAAALSDGSPTFAAPSVTAQKLTAYVTGSYEIFEDSDLQMQLPGLIGEAFSFKEQTAFISGAAASNQPNGIVTLISATAGDTVTCTTRGAFTSASAVDVFALLAAVPSRYEDTGTWVANKAWFNTVRQMSTSGNGSFFWTNFNNDTTGQGGSQHLLGSPTVQASDMNTSFASGSVIAILGDWSQFVIYDRIGTTVEFVQNVFNSSAVPLGQRGLIAHKRVGSDCTDLNAFRFLKA